MTLHLIDHRNGFGPGFTAVTTLDESEDATGIALGVHNLEAGQRIEETAEVETAWLLMTGRVKLSYGDQTVTCERSSLFDELPTSLHVAAGERVVIEALAPTEIDVFQTANTRAFAPRLYHPSDVRDEHRGKGQVGDTCYRFVRTIFDKENAEGDAELVLGEVITMPGKWSSYPPHHHPQPEIYHYRFTEKQGYGHAELGDDVLKVKNFDTVKIFPPNDHAQAAAPGYGMYYSWVIRHLPDNPYTVPEFTEEHRWIMQEGAQFWQPPEG